MRGCLAMSMLAAACGSSAPPPKPAAPTTTAETPVEAPPPPEDGDGGGGIGVGKGRGLGGTGHKRPPGPRASLGQALPTGGTGQLDPAIIRRYIKRNFQKIQYCYEKQLLATPGLRGTVTATFTISDLGAVSAANASGVDPNVSSCIASVIQQIEFPKPQGGSVEVTYPIGFDEQ